MEKDTINYMKYKMGLAQKILLADNAVPSKFNCQEDRKRRLCDADLSREVFAKRQRMDVVKQCEEESHLHSQNSTETLQRDDNMMQKIIQLEAEGVNYSLLHLLHIYLSICLFYIYKVVCLMTLNLLQVYDIIKLSLFVSSFTYVHQLILNICLFRIT